MSHEDWQSVKLKQTTQHILMKITFENLFSGYVKLTAHAK